MPRSVGSTGGPGMLPGGSDRGDCWRRGAGEGVQGRGAAAGGRGWVQEGSRPGAGLLGEEHQGRIISEGEEAVMRTVLTPLIQAGQTPTCSPAAPPALTLLPWGVP